MFIKLTSETGIVFWISVACIYMVEYAANRPECGESGSFVVTTVVEADEEREDPYAREAFYVREQPEEIMELIAQARSRGQYGGF